MHLSKAVPQIFDKRAFVVAASLPAVDSLAIPLVVDIGSLILLCPILPDAVSEP